MGRPTKQTVDYFPHFVTESKTKFLLESRWGNDGYAVWFKLLEILCKTDGHAYYLNDPLDWDYFISLMRVDDDVAKSIIDKLSEIGKIDSDLWVNHKIIWCPTLMGNIKSVYDKRTVKMPTKPVFRNDKLVSKTEKGETNSQTGDFGVENPQSKVKENKVKENKVKGDVPAITLREKKTYGKEFKNVELTDDEYGKLVQRLGKDSAADYIERLSLWLAEGNKKKNHYATILNWWRKDGEPKKIRKQRSYDTDEVEGNVFKN